VIAGRSFLGRSVRLTSPALLAALALVLAPSGAGGRARAAASPSAVELRGERVAVEWLDGDTFEVAEGAFCGLRARLADVDALELNRSYRWGSADARQLAGVAERARTLAQGASWRCRWIGKTDKYGRLLVSCEELEAALVGQGLALAAAYASRAGEARRFLPAQRRAKAAGAGMWAGGRPPCIPVRVRTERGEQGARVEATVIDTETGAVRYERLPRVGDEACLGRGSEAACVAVETREVRRPKRRCP
jgi:endonuclease YncB( thermonuclease family)